MQTSSVGYRKAVRRNLKEYEEFNAARVVKTRQALSAAEALFQGVLVGTENEVELFLAGQEELTGYYADSSFFLAQQKRFDLESLFPARIDQSATDCALNFQFYSGHFDEEEGEFSINNDAVSHLLADGCFHLQPSSELVIEGHEDEFDYESIKNGRKVYF